MFASISTAPAFQALEAEFERNAAPILSGQAAFSLADADLVPEALTWDSARRRWLIGSLAKRKIIAANDEGTSTDFISHPDLLRVVGIHADPGRELLWFATWEPTERIDPSGSGRITRTRLFKADLATGRILATHEPPDTAESQLLNDHAIAPNGDLYVTDTRAGRIYRLAADGHSLEVFARPDPARFSYANGIALAGDGRTLFVAFIEGLARIDPQTRRAVSLRAPTGVSTAQVDGLYWYRGDLIAVQNAPGLERVMRYDLNAAGDSIIAAEVLERSRDLLRVPTTGVIVGTRFYYIANSQAGQREPLEPRSGLAGAAHCGPGDRTGVAGVGVGYGCCPPGVVPGTHGDIESGRDFTTFDRISFGTLPRLAWRVARRRPTAIAIAVHNRSLRTSMTDVANLGLIRPPFVYLGSIALGLVLHLLWPVRFVPDWVSPPLGAMVTLLAVVLFLSAVRTFRAARTPVPGNRPTTAIVRSGPYRFSRNPIYLAFSLLQLGLSIWVNSIALLITLIPAVALMTFVIIPREERYLEARFPSEYSRYKTSVRRWV